MSSPFSIPGWNISEIKNPNGTCESIGHKQKNVSKKSKSKFLIKVLLIIPLLAFIYIFISNKQLLIKNYITHFASNIASSDKSLIGSNENKKVVNKELITANKTVAEDKQKNTTTKKVVEQNAIQPVIVPVAIRDYSEKKPWEGFNSIKADLKTTDDKKTLDALFDYLCTFSILEKNQGGLAAVWKHKFGTIKNISELFSYVVNAGSGLKCYTVRTSTGQYWNEISINGVTTIYDIENKKVTKDKLNYQNGFRY